MHPLEIAARLRSEADLSEKGLPFLDDTITDDPDLAADINEQIQLFRDAADCITAALDKIDALEKGPDDTQEQALRRIANLTEGASPLAREIARQALYPEQT